MRLQLAMENPGPGPRLHRQFAFPYLRCHEGTGASDVMSWSSGIMSKLLESVPLNGGTTQIHPVVRRGLRVRDDFFHDSDQGTSDDLSCP